MKKLKLHNDIKSGFKTPENYFNSFEEQLLSELKLKEQVSNSGFNEPKDYFNNFKVDLSEVKPSEPKVIPLFNNKTMLYVASIAAAFILLLTIPSNNNELNFASLDNDTIEDYLLISDFESSELNDLITNTTAFEDKILEETLNNIPLEDYLYNNSELDDFNLE